MATPTVAATESKDVWFNCKVCSKRYKTARGLAQHSRIHALNKTLRPCHASSSSPQVNVLKCPIPTSTPQQPESEEHHLNVKAPNHQLLLHICTVCDKQYKSVRGLNKHILEHVLGTLDQPTFLPAPGINPITQEEEEGDESLVDEPDVIGDNQLVEEPEENYFDFDEIDFEFEEEVDRLQQGGARGFNRQEDGVEDEITHKNKKPRKEKSSKPALVSCHVCKKSYTTMDRYVRHRATHAAEDAFAKVPGINSLKEEYVRLAEEVLLDLKNENFSIGVGIEVSKIVGILLDNKSSDCWRSFVNFASDGLCACLLLGDKFLKPSHLRESFIRSSSSFLASEKHQKKSSEILSVILVSPEDAIMLTISAIITRVSKKLTAYILRVIINANSSNTHVSLKNSFAVTSQSTDSIEFKQTMHYIAGSNVKSVFRTALRRKTPSEEWKRIINTLKQCFLSGDFAQAPDSELSAWTAAVDRGKLIKVSESALNFFLKLGTLVKPLEKFDGSIQTEQVIETVLSCVSTRFLWDEIIKGNLCENESFKLLHALCSHFCVTWRNGVVSRRLDEMREQNGNVKTKTGGVAFRATLTR